MISLMRILVDVNQEQLNDLAALAARRGEPRAAVIRQAIDSFVAANRKPASAYFGIWAGRNSEDAQAFQDRMRAEWDR